MPFSVSGVYSVLIDFATEAASPPIEIAKLDQQMADLATALNNCILRDGTGAPTAAISFGSQDVTAMNSLIIAGALADTVGLTLSKDGAQIKLARSSDGALSFVIGSLTAGSGSLSIKNAGGGTSEIVLPGSAMYLATAGVTRLNISSVGAITLIAATGGANTLTIGSATGITAGGNLAVGVCFTTTANFGVFVGSGAPTINAAKGSLYLNSTGTTGITRAYIATDAVGTWTPINTVA